MMARTKQLNIGAIIKAYEMEAKRADRNAKLVKGDPLEKFWQNYACKIRQQQQQIKVED
jgi:hypothetical protein